VSIETGEKLALEEAFSVRHSIRLALARPEKLTREHTQELAQVCSLSAPVATALTLAQRFVTMRREKQVEALPSWLASAQTSSVRELRQFAQGIVRDRAAVEAAFSRAESNGIVEGTVNKLKLMKRMGYGRARFPRLAKAACSTPCNEEHMSTWIHMHV
jgi:transposase